MPWKNSCCRDLPADLMTTQDNIQLVLDFFNHNRPRLARIFGELLNDQVEPSTGIGAVIDEAAAIYASFVPDSAYVDDPHNLFADALFYCNVNLAAYLALKAHGVDVHDFGVAVLKDLAAADLPAGFQTEKKGRRPASTSVPTAESDEQDSDCW